MADVDSVVTKKLQELHVKREQQVNAQKGHRSGFSIGEKVWVHKAVDLSSKSKLEPRWKGPRQVVEQNGARSYRVSDSKGDVLDVHLDQLKRYEEAHGEGIPDYRRMPQEVQP